MQAVDFPVVRSNESPYTIRQRMLSGSVTLAMAGTFTTTCAMAHAGFADHTSVPNSVAQNAAASAFASQAAPTAMNFSAAGASHAAAAGTNAASYTQNMSNMWNNGHTAAPHVVNAAIAANDIALNNATANFTAGAMFNDLVINVGGKMVQLNQGYQMTGAELVAAQQVMNGGKQTLILNSQGVATGGTFNLNDSSLQALNAAVPGNVGSIYISRGVQVVDSLANLNLGGNLVNHGSIVMGAEHSAVGQTLDTISAVNIYNGYGASIASSTMSSLVPTSIALDASQAFYNGGKIVSAHDLNISAPVINNSGLLAATTGNVNFSGVNGGGIDFNNTNGTVQALNGSINFNQAGYAGVSNINVVGGDFLSQQVNFNAGQGNLEVNVGNVTGSINGDAGCAHVTTASTDMHLGSLNVSGDPTYYNSAGNIVIDSDLSVSAGNALAIIASGNISTGASGTAKITTVDGQLNIIAGANITTAGSALPPLTAPGSVSVIDSTNAGKGSKTGGYIDLSGITLTGKTTNTAVTAVGSTSGNVLMVAYKGTGTNSGSIVATRTSKQAVGADTVNAGTGAVTMIGGGSQITAQKISGGNISIYAQTPFLNGSTLTFDNTGKIISGSYDISGKPTAGALNFNTTAGVTALTSSGTVTLSTAGKPNGTLALPIAIDAKGLSTTGGAATSSYFIKSVGAGKLSVDDGSLVSGSTLNLQAAGDVDFVGNLTGLATVVVNAPNGAISTSTGSIGGNVTTLSAKNDIVGNIAVNTLTVNSAQGQVLLGEAVTAGKALNLNASSSGAGKDFTLTSAQTLNINGALNSGGIIDLQEDGSTNAVGINVKAVLTSASSNINLTTTGTDTIIGSKPVVANDVTINAGGNVGTAAAGFQTKASNLTLNGNAVSTLPPLLSVKDLSTGTLNVTGTAAGNPQNVQVVSSAAVVNLNKLSFQNVTVTDTVTGSKVLINGAAGNDVGNGTGIVKISANGAIDNVTTAQVKGTSVTLTSTAGSVGGVVPVLVNTATFQSSATKGSVAVEGKGAAPMTLLAGTALNNYTVTAPSLVLGGTIATTKTVTGQVSLTGTGSLLQGPATAFASSANVVLATGAGGKIGLATGVQSLQTKAVTSLSVNGGVGSSSFITNTGNLVLNTASTGAGAALNLAVGTGNKITVNSAITFNDVTLTAPGGFILGATGNVSGNSSTTVNAPTLTLNAGGILNVNAVGTMTLASPTTLAVNGPIGTITMGANSSLVLSGQNGITLGAAVGGTNDPLNTIITGGTTLSNLTIFSKGLFTGNYNSLATNNSAPANTLSVQASGLKNSGVAVLTPYKLTSNNITLAITSGLPVVLNSTNVTSGTPNFLINSLTAGSNISVTAVGKLSANTGGLALTGMGNSLSLAGSTLDTNGLASPTYFTTDNKFVNVSLRATAGTFTIGAGTVALLNNGVAGDITGTGVVTVSAPFITDTGKTISGNGIILNTSNFKLNDFSALVGTGGGASLTISNITAGGLTVSGTGGTNGIGGTYTGFANANLQSTNGGVNVGNLFTTLNGAGNMLDSKSVTNVVISAAGAISLPSKLSTLNVADNGSIYISGTSLSYAPATGNPQPFLTLAANKGSVAMYLGSALTLGQAKGQVDIQVGTTGSFVASAQGDLTINEVQNVGSATMFGNNIIVNKSVTAAGTLNIQTALTPVSKITEGAGAVLTGGTLFIAQGLSSSPTTINIATPDLRLLGGALSLNNLYNSGSTVTVTQQIYSIPLYSLNLTNNNNFLGSQFVINSIFASAGGINIVNNSGLMALNFSSRLETSNGNIPIINPDGTRGTAATLGGNITLQNNDLTSNIYLFPFAQIVAFGAAGSGLGNVNVVMGPVPTTGLAAGKQASPTPTVNTTSNGGQIYFTTTANPNGSITAAGTNSLNAKGANIVFNGAGNNSAIQLLGNVQIVADPPAAAATAATASMAPAVVSDVTTVSAPALTAVSAPITASAVSTTNWSLPTLAAIGAIVKDGISANVAGLSDGTVLSGSDVVSGLPRVVAATRKASTRVLTGGVSEGGVQTMENGATLISPKANTTIKTGFGSVDVAAGAVAMIMAYDGGMAVYNLHDNKNGAVVVKVDGNAVKLSPGQNVVLTSKSVRTFEEVNPAGGFVAYRRVTSKDWGKGVTGFHSEFSILSMLQNVGAVRELVKSQDTEMRKTIDAMLKTSAILLQLGGDKYEYKKAPDLTAMAR